MATDGGARARCRGARGHRDGQRTPVHVVSFAEIGVKAAFGKLTVPPDLGDRVLAAGLRVLELTAEHGLAVGRLPLHHRDPFDRLLIAQARAEGLSVVTADSRFGDYDVPVVPAG